MFSQIYEITVLNIRNLPSRLASSSVIVVGIAGVVGVLLGLLSMAVGFERALAGAGQPDRAIIIQEASTSEMNGNLIPSQRDAIRAMEGVVYGGGKSTRSLPLPNVGPMSMLTWSCAALRKKPSWSGRSSKL